MKISIPTPRNVIGNSNREGLSTAQIYKGKYEAILEIPGGGTNSNGKKNSMGEGWIFSGATHPLFESLKPLWDQSTN